MSHWVGGQPQKSYCQDIGVTLKVIAPILTRIEYFMIIYGTLDNHNGDS